MLADDALHQPLTRRPRTRFLNRPAIRNAARCRCYAAMNPLLYKAHPLLYRSVDLLLHPASHSLFDLVRLLSLYLILNLPWVLGLRWVIRKVTGLRLSWLQAFALALLSIPFYLPIMLTLLSDVASHSFHFRERYILLFTIGVVVVMFAGIYGALIRDARSDWIGLSAGFSIALVLLLLSMFYGLLLLGLDARVNVF
jgi:hypothetical protein